MSLVALMTCAVPSALNVILAEAGDWKAPQTPVALAQRLARKRLSTLGVYFGIVDEPKLQRVYLERVGQLVHRAFEREHAAHRARRAHPRRRREVCGGDQRRRVEVRAGVDLPREAGRVVRELLEG